MNSRLPGAGVAVLDRLREGSNYADAVMRGRVSMLGRRCLPGRLVPAFGARRGKSMGGSSASAGDVLAQTDALFLTLATNEYDLSLLFMSVITSLSEAQPPSLDAQGTS